MCGIFVTIDKKESKRLPEYLDQSLRERGPDHSDFVSRTEVNSTSNGALNLSFYSTVLSLRGSDFDCQPATSKDDNSVLCWNGEAWKLDGKPLKKHDTMHVLHKLLATTRLKSWHQSSTSFKRTRICQILNSINGPFSFVFYDANGSMIFFGRDKIGHRSLLWNRSGLHGIRISSLGDCLDTEEWEEVEALGVYSIDLQGHSLGNDVCTLDNIALEPWPGQGIQDGVHDVGNHPGLVAVGKPKASGGLQEELQDCVADVLLGHQKLFQALHLRLDNIATQSNTRYGSGLSTAKSETEKVGILFSGGLDCSIIARLANDILPLSQPIALLNVAFENPRISGKFHAMSTQTPFPLYEACPDRKTARRSFDQLRLICPGRKWKFVAINVSYEETLRHRERIKALMRPHRTEMDISIAMALYFAARGEGILELGSSSESYKVSARVLLSGLGADELFGGYMRHEKCFKNGGVESLTKELQLDFDRIGRRNLGRDDRVTSTWGKELRYPFLDSGFVDWALRLPLWKKCAFINTAPLDTRNTISIDMRGKYILRLIATSLGLGPIAGEKKRAIQFGSRSAKMLDSKSKGSDVV